MPISMNYGPDYGQFAMAAAMAGKAEAEQERRNTLADQFYQNRGLNIQQEQGNRSLEQQKWMNEQNVALGNRSQDWTENIGLKQFGLEQQRFGLQENQFGLEQQRFGLEQEKLALQEELTRAGWEHEAAMAYANAQYAQPWERGMNLIPHSYGSGTQQTQRQVARVY